MAVLFIMIILDTKLVEEKVNESEVTEIAMKVAMAKRMAEIVSPLPSNLNHPLYRSSSV